MIADSSREADRTKAGMLSLLFHGGLVLILFLYQFTSPPPITEAPEIVLNLEWGGGGDDAALGLPDQGQGNEPAAAGQQLEDPRSKTPVAEPEPAPAKPEQARPTKPAPAKQNNVLTSTDPDVAALRQKQENDRKQQQAEQDRIRREQDTERKRIADAEAEKKRQQDEYNKKKGSFGGALGKGSGGGQGNTGKPGNQGVPDGTGNNPFGKSAGTGGGSGGGSGTGTGPSIGGGLAGRKVTFTPRMVDNSQKTGKVMLEVCVDESGNVVSATYTQKGSTSNDSELRNKAIQWAKQYRFVSSSSEKECGTFAFNFQLQ